MVNGKAEIIIDKNKIAELWTPLVKNCFKEGRDDLNIFTIKVNTLTAYYWNTEGNKMFNFFKMIASVATGTTLANEIKGTINI